MRFLRRLALTLAALAALPCLLLAIGVSPGDAALMRAFAGEVPKWTHSTAPRRAALDYAVLGAATCRARFLGIRSASWTLFFRRAPGLPPSLAVNETSERHYELFKVGPIEAYLHLVESQSIDGAAESFATLQATSLDSGTLRAAVEGFEMEPRPIAHAGTTDDLRRLITEISPRDGGFIGGEMLVARLRQRLGELGRERGWGEPSVWDQTTQADALARLDDFLRSHDRDLWRSKQLTDFLIGITAQVYGRHYLLLIEPSLALRNVGSVLLPLGLAWLTLRACRRAARRQG